jgi:hypothetical protein
MRSGSSQHHAAGPRKGMQRSTTAERVPVALDELSPKVFQGGVRKIVPISTLSFGLGLTFTAWRLVVSTG